MVIGMQLTDVVETANASSSANTTFFPLFTLGSLPPARDPRGVPVDRLSPCGARRLRRWDRYCVATNEKFLAEETRSGSTTQRVPSTFAGPDPTLAAAAAPAALRVGPQPPTRP